MIESSVHDQALNWFVRLSDETASEADWIGFQSWLEADPSHQRAYDLVEQVWVALDDQESVVTPVQARSRAGGAGPRSFDLARQGQRRSVPAWIVPAFSASAVAILVFGLWPEVSGTGRFQTFTTAETVREVVLSDGSRLSMNRHSDLRARIGWRGRDVVLADGEVAFDVHHDPHRPFVVSSVGHKVRVLGTTFNVLSHDERFTVAVQRGVVEVSGFAIADDVRLLAGQRIDQTGTSPAAVSQIDPEQSSAWRLGVLIYREADLGTIADDLSRYLDKPFTVSSSAQALRFTGALRIGDEATMLGQLQDFVAIRVTQANDGIRLTARDGT